MNKMTPKGPLFSYRARLASGELFDDPDQRLAVEKLQLLHGRLAGYNPRKPKKVGLGIFGWGRESLTQSPIPGLYIYGGVGRGKSMLMDMFFDGAPVSPKRRVHFHAFMQEIHNAIHNARQHGLKDPIIHVAQDIANSATLLCFDEMQITDITDAMIVGRLFEKLFERGVIVVATSNRHPDDLYKDGLNRQLFLPFIAEIKARMEVFHLEGGADHRKSRLSGKDTYITPPGPEASAILDQAWEDLAGVDPAPLTLNVKGRRVLLPAFHNGVARACFADLCEVPLGAADYLAMTEVVRVLILDNIPLLSPENNNEAKRFVTLIDTLYEAGVGLICSAAAEPDALYQDGAGAFEFERTASRLSEMRRADQAL